MLINLANDMEDPSNPTSFKASNITLEDMAELADKTTGNSQSVGYGIFMDLVGTTNFELDDFKANNVRLQSKFFFLWW